MLNKKPMPGDPVCTEDLLAALTRLFNKGAQIEREPVDTGDGTLLFTSEIHLIDVAGKYPGDGMSAIASRLGITKGAVSQTAKKLEDKGYLERVSGEGDNKTVFIRLTAAGRRAFDWHTEYHHRVNDRIAEEFGRLTPGEQTHFLKVLSNIEAVFDSCTDIRRSVQNPR